MICLSLSMGEDGFVLDGAVCGRGELELRSVNRLVADWLDVGLSCRPGRRTDGTALMGGHWAVYP